MKNQADQTESGEFSEHADPLNNEIHGVTDEVLGELDSMDHESGSDDTTTVLLDKLRVAEAEVLRSRAEMENYRKRMQRDSDQQLKFANVPIVRDLVDVIDNLNRAIEAARGDETNTKALVDGVQMVTQQFNDALAKHGCKPIQAIGTVFDPNIHQAIAQMPSQDVPAGTVAMEVAVGYMLHDRVIRPAQVIVSSGNGS